jgi:dimethylamine/trimethylamine dehydrogenase
MHAGVTVTDRRAGGIGGRTDLGDPFELDVDDVVLVTHQVPRDDLHRALLSDPDALAAAGIEAVHLIGDAMAPRWISESVFDGHRLAREIDGPHPAFPLPHLRDHPA